MLATHSTSLRSEVPPGAPAVSWIDLLRPTSEERASVEGEHGIGLPTRDELSGVELSSRISLKNGILYLSMPTVSHMSELERAPSPPGFALSKPLLVTIRYLPTLVASTYGMNFRNMPELSWAWRYPYALVVILLSGVLRILWFRWRRWV